MRAGGLRWPVELNNYSGCTRVDFSQYFKCNTWMKLAKNDKKLTWEKWPVKCYKIDGTEDSKALLRSKQEELRRKKKLENLSKSVYFSLDWVGTQLMRAGGLKWSIQLKNHMDWTWVSSIPNFKTSTRMKLANNDKSTELQHLSINYHYKRVIKYVLQRTAKPCWD